MHNGAHRRSSKPFHHRAKKGVKGAGTIAAGAVLIKNTALTPDGWKIAPTSANIKPSGVLIVQDSTIAESVSGTF